MFKDYNLKVRGELTKTKTQKEWISILETHRKMLSRIQTERLIHLLVTIFVGLVMSFVTVAAIVTKEISLLLICIPLMMLFIGYLFHYRFLENTAQSWYLLEDSITNKISETI